LIYVAGVEDGQTIRMSIGRKELFVTIRVEESKYFKRSGADVHTEAGISLSQAVLGGTIRIEGVYEDHTVQVSYEFSPLGQCCVNLLFRHF